MSSCCNTQENEIQAKEKWVHINSGLIYVLQQQHHLGDS